MGDVEKAAATKNEVAQALASLCRLLVTPLTPNDMRNTPCKDYMRDLQLFVLSFFGLKRAGIRAAMVDMALKYS